MKAVTLVITTEGSQWWDSAALTWAEFLRWLRWLGECDLMEPLEEEVILLMLHMLDLRDPIELGELGGECWKQKQNNSGYLWLDVKLSTSFDGSESKAFLNIQVYDKVLFKLEIMQGQVWNNKWHLFYKCKMNKIWRHTCEKFHTLLLSNPFTSMMTCSLAGGRVWGSLHCIHRCSMISCRCVISVSKLTSWSFNSNSLSQNFYIHTGNDQDSYSDVNISI